LVGAFVALSVYVLAGAKWSPFAPTWITSKFGMLAAFMFAGYVASLWIWRGDWPTTFWAGAFCALPPLLFLTFPTAKLAFVEYAKEHPLYRRVFIFGRGGEAGRWGSLREFFRRDMTGFFRRNASKIKRTETSDIYLDRTLLEDDIRIGGRDVGIVGGEQHLMTVAGTGASKSRDAIFNTLLSYSGGVVAFDMKGEIFRVCHQRRAQYERSYLLDPYGECRDIRKTDYWNPLDEIDPLPPSARPPSNRTTERPRKRRSKRPWRMPPRKPRKRRSPLKRPSRPRPHGAMRIIPAGSTASFCGAATTTRSMTHGRRIRT